jgi:perosamine synthetase
MSTPAVTLHYYRGRVALAAILNNLGAVGGDEVIVQAYTCVAVLNPLVRLGLRPVFVDIDRRTLTMDLDGLRHAVSGRTRAVVVQHTFGVPADLVGALKITQQAGVPIIEDCAHVLGARLGGQPLGSFGAAAFFSHEWGKPVVAGVGGTAVANEAGLARRMREQYSSFAAPPLRRELVMSLQYLAHRAVPGTALFWQVRALYGRLSKSGVIVGSYDADPRTNPEYGWRMTRTVRMRLSRCEAKARKNLDHRKDIEARYWAGLAVLGFPRLTVPDHTDAVAMRVPVAVGAKGLVLEAAQRHGVEMGDWYNTPVHPLVDEDLHTVGYQRGCCPNAEWAAKHVVTLPVRATTRFEDVDRTLELLAQLRARCDA